MKSKTKDIQKAIEFEKQKIADKQSYIIRNLTDWEYLETNKRICLIDIVKQNISDMEKQGLANNDIINHLDYWIQLFVLDYDGKYYKKQIKKLQFLKSQYELDNKEIPLYDKTDQTETNQQFSFGKLHNGVLTWDLNANQLAFVLFQIKNTGFFEKKNCLSSTEIVKYCENSNKIILNKKWKTVENRINDSHNGERFKEIKDIKKAIELIQNILS